MKLFYITKVSIPSSAAQSVQIASMCEVFGKKDIHFELYSPLNNENKNISKPYKWNKIKLLTKFRYLEMIIRMILIVIRKKPTHIFTREIAIAYVFSFFNLKTIYEAHKEPKTKTASFMIKQLKKFNNFKLVTISKALKDYYINEYNYEENQVFDYHDGVFLEKYDTFRNISKEGLRKKLDLPIDKTIIMHTGSLYKGKDAELFKSIVDNLNDILFIQIGGSKEDITRYKEFYKDNKNIIFIGHQDHEKIIQYQMSADLLFYALTKSNSLWQFTSPLKLFEYMATGIPILGSNIGSVREVLNETNSIPFDPEDEQSIVDGVRFYLKNKVEVEKRAKNALKDVREKYTWDKRAKSILEFIK